MKYDVIIFDLDGTLLDTIGDLSAAVDHALRSRGLPLHEVAFYTRTVGHGVRNLVQRSLPTGMQEDGALVDACLADFKAYYSSHIDVLTRPYPGVPELLRELHRSGVRLAVASNKFQEGTERLVREFFPEVPFAALLGNREGFPLKPDPAIVREALSAAGHTGLRAALVGDSPTDMRTARNGGIDGIGVGWGYRAPEEIAPLATCMAPSVSALRDLLLA